MHVSLRLALSVAVLVAAEAAHADPPRLTFAAAMQRALARNPDALVAGEEIARARAIVAEVRAGSLPTLGGVITFTQLDSPRLSTATGGLITPESGVNVAGTAGLTLDPRRWVQWSQARTNATVTRLAAADVRRQLAVIVGQTYLALVAQRQIVKADELAVRNAAAHVDYTQARLTAGAGTLLDHERALALANSDRALYDRAQFLVARLQEQLGILLGESAPVDVTAEVVLPPAPLGLDVALGEGVSRRSDLRLSRERLRAATDVRRQSWADFLPSATASFDVFYQSPPTQAEPTFGWELAITVGVPLYDGGLRYGLIKERRALEQEAVIRRDAELRLVGADVRTALAELAHARASLVTAREAARLDTDVVRLTEVSYRAGLSTNIEVIDAQTASLNADITAALAENDERQAELDLLLATGRLP